MLCKICYYELQTPMLMDVSSLMFFIHSCFSFFPVIFHPRSLWGSLAHYISSIEVGSFICPPLICTHSCLVRHISSPPFFGSCPSYFFNVFCVFLPVFCHPLFLGSSCLSYFFHESWFIHLSAAHSTLHVSYVIFHPRKFVYSSVRRSSPPLARICVYAFVCLSRGSLSAMASLSAYPCVFFRFSFLEEVVNLRIFLLFFP